MTEASVSVVLSSKMDVGVVFWMITFFMGIADGLSGPSLVLEVSGRFVHTFVCDARVCCRCSLTFSYPGILHDGLASMASR